MIKMETGKSEIKLQTAENFWSALENAYTIWSRKDDGNTLSFHPERKAEFLELFDGYYETIKGQFMTLATKGLDAHKQAAIMVISVLEANIFEQSKMEGKVSLGVQAIVLDVALSYLEKSINGKLKEIGIHAIRLELPMALACETSYFNILRRILYYENNENGSYEMKYNIIEWADRFFLLEYIVLLKNGIDPQIVKDSSRATIKS